MILLAVSAAPPLHYPIPLDHPGGKSWKEPRSAFAVSLAPSPQASRPWSISAIAATASDVPACPGPAMPIFQKKMFGWMDRIQSTREPATRGPGSIIISVRTAVSLFVSPAQQDRHASAFPWVHLTIPRFPRRRCRSGRKRVTHGRHRSATSSIGTPNRRRLDASALRTQHADRRPRACEDIVLKNNVL
jgi:hypothetical protein